MASRWLTWLDRLPWPGEQRRIVRQDQTGRVKALLAQGKAVALIYLDLVDFSSFEETYGFTTSEQMLKKLRALVPGICTTLFGKAFLGFDSPGGDDFAIYLNPDQENDLAETLARQADALADNLERVLAENSRGLSFHRGYALITPEPKRSAGSLLYLALKQAMTTAKMNSDLDFQRRLARLKEIIYQRQLTTLYQPIVSLTDGSLIGLEALTRGPEGTDFYSPQNLFSFAEEAYLLYSLEKAARETAINSLPAVAQNTKLFLNISPQVVHDPAFTNGYTKALLEQRGLTPQNIVFEVTERAAIRDYHAFERTIGHYRRQGFKIAVDDTGSGYSSLQSLAELKPEYIKLDLSLVQDVHRSRAKAALLETLLQYARKVGAVVIAEGIEEEADLKTLLHLGIPLGQGFLLARPGYPPPAVAADALTIIHSYRPQIQANTPSIKNIARPAAFFNPQTLTREVSRFFEVNPQASCVVILNDERPVAMITRDTLYRRLSTQYGLALYWDKPVVNLTEHQPLVLDAGASLEEASRLAMARPEHHLYDEFIVVEDGKYLGNVSVQSLLDAITRQQLELARFANPLTELPGNQRIQQEITRRLEQGSAFRLIYADLDNFKSFNDFYGFERGDQVLLLVRDLLEQALERYAEPTAFLGHIGGDDFVILTAWDSYLEMARWIAAEFDRRIPSFYDPAAREQGYILACDRQGQEQVWPLMTISLAIVDTGQRRYANHLELSEAAAEVKKAAKAKPGSAVFVDRREGPWGNYISL